MPRTLLDLASTTLPDRRIERALEEVERRELYDTLSLPDLLTRHPRRRGSARLRGVLESWRPGSSWTRSDGEEAFLALVDRHGIRRPRSNTHVYAGGEWSECDFVWQAERVVVELDSYEWHGGSRASFERDRAKWRRLGAAKWQVLVVTARQLAVEPTSVAADVVAALSADLDRPAVPAA